MSTINRRLRKLEERIALPSREPQTIQIQFVSPDGEVRDGPLFTIGGPGHRMPPPKEPIRRRHQQL